MVTEASSGVGEPLANTEVCVMDEETGTELKAGQRGELWARGPNLMKGYWRNPKATKDTMTPDGWLKTGDIAYIDDRGIVFIVDRMKELIKVKGLQVARKSFFRFI
jgi:4-coumarate--CoA ligase